MLPVCYFLQTKSNSKISVIIYSPFKHVNFFTLSNTKRDILKKAVKSLTSVVFVFPAMEVNGYRFSASLKVSSFVFNRVKRVWSKSRNEEMEYTFITGRTVPFNNRHQQRSQCLLYNVTVLIISVQVSVSAGMSWHL